MPNQGLSRLGDRIVEPPISWLMKAALDEPSLVSLAAGFTDNASLPVAYTGEIVERLLKEKKSAQPSLQYGATLGLAELRQASVDRIAHLDGSSGKAYDPERCLISHGSQQLLYMLVEALCDEGDIVLVEDPTYFVFLGILQSRGIRAVGVKLTEGGIDPVHLESVLTGLQTEGVLSRVKMLYLVTYFQNPTGYTTQLSVKNGALKLLKFYERHAGHPIYLLEDAAYRELQFLGEPEPSALSLKGGAERVLYAGTYSKPFATGLRVGFGILPPAVLTATRRIKGNHDFGTSHFLQQILAAALERKLYAAHLKQLRTRYAKKALLMVKAIQKHFPLEVNWLIPQGGLYVWAAMPPNCDVSETSKFFKRAKKSGVLYVPGHLCYAEDPARPRPKNEMRISFGGAKDDQIPKGIRLLGEVCSSMLKER